MRGMFMLVCAVCAALMSVLATLYATGRYYAAPPEEMLEERRPRSVHVSLLPEQSRAVAELMEAIIAREEEVERKEKRLDERQVRVRQEVILLDRMREELAAAQEEMNAHFRRLDEMKAQQEAEERGNIRKLAESYARMEPQNAARLLAEMESQRAARILFFIGDRQVAAIMDASVAMGPDGIERAVEWSELIRQLRSDGR